MDNEKKQNFRAERHDRFWTGLALLIVGAVLLADKMGVDFPVWLFDWPPLLILAGIVTGLKCNFRNSTWLIMIGVGTVFLVDRIGVGLNFREYLWPILIIVFGLLFVLRPKKRWHRKKGHWDGVSYVNVNPVSPQSPTEDAYATHSGEDVIESVSVFGGVKRVVTSKNFKGGEIICFMGGAEYNFSQADITGPVTIEIIQAFGGTKLIVPPHWEIRSESVAIFAGFEDKRPSQPGAFDPNKILILKGTTIFGGIEIKSY
jgi:hypothetical protein